MITWKYSDAIPKKRVDDMLTHITTDALAENIAENMQFLCCHYQVCGDNPDFGRVAYSVGVSEDLFDLFYNSPYGYRGAFYRSTGEGIDANAIFVGKLAPKLMSHSEVGATQNEKKFIRESLTSPSAKMWLAENGLGVCPNCEGEWGNPKDSLPEILNGRWEIGDEGSSRKGRKVPRLSKIRVFGAFLDDRYNEFVPKRKRHRAKQIHQWGWS